MLSAVGGADLPSRPARDPPWQVPSAPTVALGLAACAGTGSTVATAQSPQCDNGMLCGDSVDKDKETAQITASEWSSTFQGMDTNGDGVVSQSEFQAVGGQWGGGGGHGR